MATMRKNLTTPVIAYIATPFLITLVSWVLFALQNELIRHEGEYINAYAIGFLLPIGFLTRWGGRGPGIFALVLSLLMSVYVLMHPHFTFGVKLLSDWTALAFQVPVGILLITAIDNALRNKNLRLQAQLSTAREVLINQIGQDIRRSINPEEVEITAMKRLGEALGADRSLFIVCNAQDKSCVIEREWYRQDLSPVMGVFSALPYDVLLNEWFIGEKTRVINNVQSTAMPQETKGTLSSQVGAALIAMPQFIRGNLVAILFCATVDAPREWSKEEIALAEAVAAQALAALESARTLQREQHIATILQDALQPGIPPDVPGLNVAYFYKSALEEANIGGDFYDVFLLNDYVSAVIIGDVSGKGLDAAAQIATIRNMLRFVLYQESSLALAISNLNAVLTQHALLSGFVTVLASVFDCRSKCLTYISCGHEPGLLLRTATGQIEELPPTGPLLGVMSAADYREKSVTLSCGDTVLFYTDGVSDAGPSRSRPLGVSGLETILSKKHPEEDARTLSSRISQETIAYAEGILLDDLCIVTAIVQ